MRNLMAFCAVLLVICGQAVADGKFYYVPDRDVPAIPHQRAFILYLGGEETLFLQSKYKVEDSIEGKSLGWVVPVPAEPELASMDPKFAYNIFQSLAWNSMPDVTVQSKVLKEKLIIISFFLTLALLIFSIIARIFCYSYCVSHPLFAQKHKMGMVIVRILPYFSFALVFYSIAAPNLMRSRLMAGVDILQEERVGVYDAKVIKSDSSEALVAWLNEGGFHFEEKDVKVFDDYVKNGWCFVVANLAQNTASREISYEGLAAPLILRFPCEKPIYPLALTGTGGYNTEVLVYLASEEYLKCDEARLELKFAGKFHSSTVNDHFRSCEPEEFFKYDMPPNLNLTKYKGILTPEQMSTDLSFTPTNEDISYQEHITVWSEEDLQ
jgi:hypothetical protein